MLTKRTYFTVTCVMLLMLFMFQFAGIIKNKYNDYSVNSYAQECINGPSGSGATEVITSKTKVLSDVKPYVVYVGSLEGNGSGSVVKQWCTYAKYNVLTYTSVSEYELPSDKKPDMILIDSDYVNVNTDIPLFKKLSEEGINLVFCSLPDFKVISGNAELMELLGISIAIQENATLSGIKLYSGFFLGGSKWYIKEEDTEGQYQDMDLEVPWYIAGPGTKTYMSGVLDSSTYGTTKNENLPGLIWRRSTGNSYVFAVNGDYMEEDAGLGILYSMVSEMRSEYLYPVVNAQSIVMLNYPLLSDEKNQEMFEHYGRNTTSVQRDIVWTDITRLTNRLDAKMTFMPATKLDFQTNSYTKASDTEFYFRLFKESGAEAGLMASKNSGMTVSEKMKKDNAIFGKSVSDYAFLSVYINDGSKNSIPQGSQEILQNIRMCIKDETASEPVMSFASENAAAAEFTADGLTYTFSADFRQRSIQTALGYSAVRFQAASLYSPETTSWDSLYKKFSSNIINYWNPYPAFSKCTLAQTGLRIRRFLAAGYTCERKEDNLYVNVSGFQGETNFILRLHNEIVTEVEGGSFTKIEDGAYLITVSSAAPVIHLDESQSIYYK